MKLNIQLADHMSNVYRKLATTCMLTVFSVMLPSQQIPINIPSAGYDVFSLNETVTNKVWIDEKIIYRKVVYLPNLPNTTTFNYPHNIGGPPIFTHISGVGFSVHGGAWPFPLVNYAVNHSIQMAINGPNICVSTGYDYSPASAYIILEYIKY